MTRTRIPYVVEFQYSSGMPAAEPGPPHPVGIHTSMVGCVGDFQLRAESCDRNGITEADGGPIGWVYDAGTWDGITYAEGLVACITYGPRGGMRVERV